MVTIPVGTQVAEKATSIDEPHGAGRKDTILVLDFGGQYTHMIARRVRDVNVYSEVVPCNTSAEEITRMSEAGSIKGLVLSGGPLSVYDDNAPKFDERILHLGIPVLGLCYGHQLIAKLSGGMVERAAQEEYGPATATIANKVGLLRGLSTQEPVWMSHGDTVFAVAKDFETLARTKNTPVAAFRHMTEPLWGLQWHPEVTHTQKGMRMIQNYVYDVCGCSQDWKVEGLATTMIEDIREKIGDSKCVVSLSGGVDSSTAATLVAKAIGGANLTAVYVDTGLMRQGETEEIKKVFGDLGVDLRVVEAEERFMEKLHGVSDPEKKREAIGDLFGRIFDEIGREISADFLVQGTIYPDRVESGATGKAAKIKTHHNVGGLPKDLKFKGVVEPLCDLYKDEVRKLARAIALPESIAGRQPFPGPGLAIRIMGEITEEKIRIERKADHIVTQEILASGWAPQLAQYFAVLTNTMSTGVKGDARAYGHVVVIRAIVSEDFMTGEFAKIPLELLGKISTRITNEIPEVNRVVYDVTNKPPATVEWE